MYGTTPSWTPSASRPQSFTHGGVISHVLAYVAGRREALAGVLRELGAPVRSSGDPIEWEASR